MRQSAARIRAGYTLMELVVATASATFLMAGLGASVMVTTTAFRPETNTQHVRTSAAQAQRDLLTDLQLATGFTERTDKAVSFAVPDRDGDSRPESLRYSWSGVSGAPLLFSYNGSAPIPVLNDVRSLSLTYLTQAIAATPLPAEQTGNQVLYFVNDAKSPSADELEWKSLLESWNFQVMLVGSASTPNELSAAMANSKAVFLADTLTSMSAKFAVDLSGYSIGIVNLIPDLADEIGFATSVDGTLSGTVNVQTTNHSITQGLSTGNQAVVKFSCSMAQLTDNPAKSLNQLANVNSNAALVTINPGKTLSNGGTAAGRRVMVPWGESLDPKLLTSTGQQLTCRALEWACGLGAAIDTQPKNFGCETILASTSGTSGVQYSTRGVLVERGRLKSISAYVGGASDQVRFAIYSNKNGEPSQLLAQSAVGTTTTSMAWVTLTMPDTLLDPGDYWLAMSFRNSSQRYRFDGSAGAGSRTVSNAAVTNGFLSNWGTSSSSSVGTRSIYATYEAAP